MIIVEDGTVVDGANSYASVAQLLMYIMTRYPEDTITVPQCEALLLRTMPFIEQYNFKGYPVTPFHTVKWPRKDICFLPCVMWPEGKIPPQLVEAQLSLSLGIHLEGDEAITPPQNIRREKVGQVEVEFYSNGGVGTESVYQQQAIAALRPFTDYLRSIRV